MTIMVVEDNEALNSLYSRALRSSGFRTTSVTTLAQAVEILEREVPDAVVLDLHLPDGSGLSLIERLQEHEATRGTRIIAVSGTEHYRKAEDIHGVHYLLRKPVTVFSLVDTVKYLLPPLADQYIG
ncbi:MAG: response regulator [Anaerolineae bacterium]|nr:response regulator [Anaerolineae bacterium]